MSASPLPFVACIWQGDAEVHLRPIRPGDYIATLRVD
jgi:hypothetical protein